MFHIFLLGGRLYIFVPLEVGAYLNFPVILHYVIITLLGYSHSLTFYAMQVQLDF